VSGTFDAEIRPAENSRALLGARSIAIDNKLDSAIVQTACGRVVAVDWLLVTETLCAEAGRSDAASNQPLDDRFGAPLAQSVVALWASLAVVCACTTMRWTLGSSFKICDTYQTGTIVTDGTQQCMSTWEYNLTTWYHH
jgi:hypothetical protein